MGLEIYPDQLEPQDKDVAIWRFMNMRKFRDLITTAELYFCRADLFANDEREGLPPEESDSLLNYLFDHQEQRRFCYEHVWRKGDYLLWDNRCTTHARTDFPSNECRLLRRIIVLGEKPV